MFSYAQLDENGVVHTVMETNSEIIGSNIVPVPELNHKYLGCLWDGTTFRKLIVLCNRTELVVDETTNVNIYWVDADGNPINYGDDVELKCGEISELAKMTNGKGTTIFESAEPGEFELVAVSSHGVTTSVKVVVS